MNNYHFPLVRREEIASGTFAIWLDMRGSDFTFQPGQWVDLALISAPLQDGLGNSRTLSIASSPHERDQLLFVMRSGKSAFKRNLWEVPLGTVMQLSEPGGSFILLPTVERPLVFFAGGIGIAPMRSMLAWIVYKKLDQRIYLFYSNRTAKESAFMDELIAWSRIIHLRFIPTITDMSFNPGWKYEKGRIDRVMIERHLKGVTNPFYYIAGPPSMVLSMWQLLYSMGVTDESIRTEEFPGY